MRDGSYSLFPFLMAGFLVTVFMAGMNLLGGAHISWWVVFAPWVAVTAIVVIVVLAIAAIFSMWK